MKLCQWAGSWKMPLSVLQKLIRCFENVSEVKIGNWCWILRVLSAKVSGGCLLSAPMHAWGVTVFCVLWAALPLSTDLASAPPSPSWRGSVSIDSTLLKCSKGFTLQGEISASRLVSVQLQTCSFRSLWNGRDSSRRCCASPGGSGGGSIDMGGCEVVVAWANSVAEPFVGSSPNTSGGLVPSWRLAKSIKHGGCVPLKSMPVKKCLKKK